ncbi:MAG: 30S ribosomal protein S8 [candidate division FCPU426 bacterium]
MSMNDPISDLLTRVRNANDAGHEKVDIPSSRLKQEIVRILKAEGYIKNFRYVADDKQGTLRVYFKRPDTKEKVITNLTRISKPGLRVYVRKAAVPRVLGGMGTAVISTPKGLMCDREARMAGLGGEHLFNIW